MAVKKSIENYKAVIDNKTNFLDITDSYPKSLEEASVIISQIPYEMTTSYIKGTKNGAKAIIENSAYVELFDERYDLELDKLGIATLKQLALNKAQKEDDKLNMIYEHALDVFSHDALPIFIGGEHTITAPIIKALLQKEGDDFAVISFDAHSDLRYSYEDNVNSHACVMRRIHQDLEVPIAEIGIRAQCKDEYDYIKLNNIHVLYAHQINKDSCNWLKKALKNLPKKVYISFDFDVLDPSIMMATGTIEPNGISYKQAMDFIESIAIHSQVIGMDFVEHSPTKEERYSYIAAKLIANSIATVTHCGGFFTDDTLTNIAANSILVNTIPSL